MRSLFPLVLVAVAGCHRLLPFEAQSQKPDASVDRAVLVEGGLEARQPGEARPDTRPRPPDLRPLVDHPRVGGDKGCGPGLTPCGGFCVNLQIDLQHCGGCDVVCTPGLDCKGGVCTCDQASGCSGGICCKDGCCEGGQCCGGYCCKTCCTPSQVCSWLGASHLECGSGGVACEDCFANPCLNGKCASTYPTGEHRCEYGAPLPEGAACGLGGKCRGGACCLGCWDGIKCRDYTSVDGQHCGKDGALCTSCGTDVQCNSWECPGYTCKQAMWLDGTKCNGGAGTCVSGTCQ